MIKYICDICKKELDNLEERAIFQMVERNYIFLKHQKQDTIKKTEWLFCIKCGRDMFEKMQELGRKENEKTNT